jgi:hypothetical protein
MFVLFFKLMYSVLVSRIEGPRWLNDNELGSWIT